MDDPEYKQIKYVQKDMFKEFGLRIIFWEFFPIFRFFDRKKVKKLETTFEDSIQMITNKFQSHYKGYDESIVRDFCDTLITAKNDALREGKESVPYLTDANLAMAIFDVFLAGTDTSQATFRWLLFLMLYYPEIEKKLRQEIESQIGDRLPTHEDRNQCHYTMAFISETLRHRNIVPQGVNHKAVVRSKIGITLELPDLKN